MKYDSRCHGNKHILLETATLSIETQYRPVNLFYLGKTETWCTFYKGNANS